MDALLLANPICLKRHGRTVESLDALLSEAGLTVAIELLPARPDVAAWRDRLRHEAPTLVVAAGGDGTVHQIANMVVPLGIPLGVLPLGTANDFARTLHVPMDPAAAARVIAEEAPIGVDVGTVGGHYFLNAAHLGLGVETAKRTNPLLKNLLGPVAYMLAAASAWVSAEPLQIECCIEGAQCVNVTASQLLVGNGRYFGGGMIIARDATLDDGLLDVHVLHAHVGPAEAIRLAAAARHGTLEDQSALLHARTNRFTARLSRPVEVNLDGELVWMDSELVFEVLPRALRMRAPAVALEPVSEPGAIASEMI